MSVVNTSRRNNPPDAPFFALELEPSKPDGLVFVAATCSDAEGGEELEMRRYAMALLHEFFRTKGGVLEVGDYRLMLRNAMRFIRRKVLEKWEDAAAGLDLALLAASPTRLFAARYGAGGLFLHQGEETRALFGGGTGGAAPAVGAHDEAEVVDATLRPGDVVILCNPSVAGVMGPRDIGVILKRASDPAKASLFLSAIAERKGAQGSLAAVVWEVPNYQGAALLTEEQAPPASAETGGPAPEEEPVSGGELSEEEHAERAKRQWLSRWRRRRE